MHSRLDACAARHLRGSALAALLAPVVAITAVAAMEPPDPAPVSNPAPASDPAPVSNPAPASDPAPVSNPAPASDPPTLSMPDSVEPPPVGQDNARLRERIQRMIERPEAAEETGDPVLDGILDALRTQGSVLDGSALDPSGNGSPLRGGAASGDAGGGDASAGEAAERRPMPPRITVPVLRDPPGTSMDAVAGAATPGPSEQDYLLAEQLLKTARMLSERQDAAAGAQRALIERLREEARRLLVTHPTAESSASDVGRSPPAIAPPEWLPPEPAPQPARYQSY